MENKPQKGISLCLSIMIMGILLAISLGVSTILFGQIRMIRGMGDSVMAFFAADTGIERALYDPQPTLSGSLDGSSYQVTVKCSPTYLDCPSGFEVDSDCLAPYFCYKSVGEFKEVRRAIEVER